MNKYLLFFRFTDFLRSSRYFSLIVISFNFYHVECGDGRQPRILVDNFWIPRSKTRTFSNLHSWVSHRAVLLLFFAKDLMLLDSSNVHPIKERRQISSVNDVFCYSLNMHWLSGTILKYCRYYSKQRKYQMCEVNMKQHKKTRKINKFELLFILVMMTGSSILVLLKLIGSTNPVLCDLNKFSHSL